ncbi:LysE family translocator [Thalassotalea sp. G2M2-11]|uniref:LysE family translocator n=1 Tax=Thalassotalea sp. G2M2-11 TaxID=2787627 RepID=UPI0019D302BB|nr:LysE family translocator [Thalassotalea sp. G2M2-11]
MEIIALILFVLSSSGTPGPNNVMLLTSGVNHGVRQTIPHVLGINLGFPIMVICVGLGLVSLFQQFPMLYTVLKVIGILYLLYLAYKIATISQIERGSIKQPPFTFMQAACFQWLNPKAWVMAVSAIVAFSSAQESATSEVAVIALVYLLFGLPCSFFWLMIGAGLKNVLENQSFLVWFNRGMAAVLVLSILPMIESSIV